MFYKASRRQVSGLDGSLIQFEIVPFSIEKGIKGGRLGRAKTRRKRRLRKLNRQWRLVDQRVAAVGRRRALGVGRRLTPSASWSMVAADGSKVCRVVRPSIASLGYVFRRVRFHPRSMLPLRRRSWTSSAFRPVSVLTLHEERNGERPTHGQLSQFGETSGKK